MLLQVCDVGGGTGFCTLGVVETVRPENVTLVDQSPHQLAKAKAKAALQRVTIKEVCTISVDFFICGHALLRAVRMFLTCFFLSLGRCGRSAASNRWL